MAIETKKNSNATRKKVRIKKIIERLKKAHPDAKLDLDFTNPLELLIALILAAQARDDLVNRVTDRSFQEIPDRGRLRQRDAAQIGRASPQDQFLPE